MNDFTKRKTSNRSSHLTVFLQKKYRFLNHLSHLRKYKFIYFLNELTYLIWLIFWNQSKKGVIVYAFAISIFLY
ncbi:hypothetical protein B0A62_16975 [Flavobacterium hydatis]|uniref:Uncharacterized protein n=1 Tax=Flavobacterium hydatis TaxID=991 RepID=A0A086AFG1_FLAHY|nr:hypothetical protein IW20_14110 [Flavobacterium hydatis]OXA91372.1 hypothetical protein B0A62_16975 [Flavobacterium hydatis]